MPLTALLFTIGALSLGGIPILSGFWSKDGILAAVYEHLPPVFLVLTLVTVFFSALYMARAVYVVFFGPLRHEHEHVHDAPPSMAITMSLLGILAFGFGLISFNWPGEFDGIGIFVFLEEPETFHFIPWLGILSILLAVLAFGFAFLVYVRRSISLQWFRTQFAPLIKIVENKYYIDEMYQWTIDRVVLVFSAFIALFDRAIVNDVAVNGPANAVRRMGVTLRLHITGHVYSYALAMALGAIGLAIFWWLQSA